MPASQDDDNGIKSGLAWLQVRAMASILHLPGREPCSKQGRRLTCSHCSPPGSSGTDCLFRGLSITEFCLLSTISTSSLLLSFHFKYSNRATAPLTYFKLSESYSRYIQRNLLSHYHQSLPTHTRPKYKTVLRCWPHCIPSQLLAHHYLLFSASISSLDDPQIES